MYCIIFHKWRYYNETEEIKGVPRKFRKCEHCGKVERVWH